MNFRFRIRVRSLTWLSGICLVIGLLNTAAAADYSILVFSKTLLFRHASITNGIEAIKKLGQAHHFSVDCTEDSSWFTSGKLSHYRAVVFLSTSGEVLNPQQKVAFSQYIEAGGGLAGVHAAVFGDLATEGNWTWYSNALCASFTNHSSVVPGVVRVEDSADPSMAMLPPRWARTDEWYNFISSPRGKAHILASLDETTYKGGTMGADHPIAWCHRVGKGRIWYTGLGHTAASFSEPLFLAHLLGGIELAAGVAPGNFSPR